MRFHPKALSLWCLTAAATTMTTSTTTTTATAFTVVATKSTTAATPLRRKLLLSTGTSKTCSSSSTPSLLTTAGQGSSAWLSSSAAAISRGGAAGGGYASTSTSMSMSTSVEEVETTKKQPMEIFRTDYKPLDMVVSKINMDFNIQEGKTLVTSELFVEKNPSVNDPTSSELVLDGDETSVKLLDITMNGIALKEGEDYTLEQPGKLIVKNVAPGSIIKTQVEIVPETNTQLSGLYKDDDSDMYCTQCEAMGFRRITYYPDRPDNMAVFERVRLEASAADYPVLLANGNLIEEGSLGENRHYAVWSDPYPKPSYLFCCVVGKLGKITDTYRTKSGRNVDLQLFSEPNNIHKLQYAMESLKRSMEWDEDVYGLEYDLDLYNIVAVNSFNMGAMENKGLNVFNTAYVLADQKTATDTDFERVEGVIGHEYFHNWTGNRVTCRDWFQLTLKEGLTVFRDQEFSGDMNSKAVNRIENVQALRARQFAEDAGPMVRRP
jgi:aminopeptidase N